MRESNSHEDLAKVPGSHYINPPKTLAPRVRLERTTSKLTVSRFYQLSYWGIILLLVGLERIELSTHGPKPRVLPLNYTE